MQNRDPEWLSDLEVGLREQTPICLVLDLENVGSEHLVRFIFLINYMYSRCKLSALVDSEDFTCKREASAWSQGTIKPRPPAPPSQDW